MCFTCGSIQLQVGHSSRGPLRCGGGRPTSGRYNQKPALNGPFCLKALFSELVFVFFKCRFNRMNGCEQPNNPWQKEGPFFGITKLSMKPQCQACQAGRDRKSWESLVSCCKRTLGECGPHFQASCGKRARKCARNYYQCPRTLMGEDLGR